MADKPKQPFFNQLFIDYANAVNSQKAHEKRKEKDPEYKRESRRTAGNVGRPPQSKKWYE